MQGGNTKAKVAGSLNIDCNTVPVRFFKKNISADWLKTIAKVDGFSLGHLSGKMAFQLIKLL